MLKKTTLMFIIFFTAVQLAFAVTLDPENIPGKKRTNAGLYLDSKEAYALMQNEGAKTLFIDVRTPAEVAFVGMPTVADANIPFKFTSKMNQWDEKRKNFRMMINPNFASDVIARLAKKGLDRDDKVLVMCRSGGRSAKAADALTAAGFTKVYSVIDGFEGDTVKSGAQKGKRTLNGWKNHDLPWSFSLDKNKMYLSGKSKGKAGKPNKMLKKMDADKDGMITQAEFDRHHKQKFGKIDQNNNGILETNEMEQFKKAKMKEKMNAKKGKSYNE